MRVRETQVTADELPALAMSAPDSAACHARAILGVTSPALDVTFALHALGIVERNRGQIGRALRYLRRGLRTAVDTGLTDRRIELSASLGTALGLAGRKREALAVFDEALADADHQARARVLVRRGALRVHLGDFEGGYVDNAEAASIAAQLGDVIWECRARQNTGAALLYLGRFDAADQQLAHAQAMAEEHGDSYSATVALHNRADCAHRQGRLPKALHLLYQAHRRYEDLGSIPTEIVRDTAVIQLAAGLTEEAATTADVLVDLLAQDRNAVLNRIDGCIAAAIVHLAAGNAHRAIELARRAERSSRRQKHSETTQHARFVLLRAQAAAGSVTRRHVLAAAELAASLSDWYSSERLDAQVLAGRMALTAGLTELAEVSFSAAAAQRGRGSALRRATAWYARAQLASLRGDRRGMLRACMRGLDVLDAHALSLGALELRARATVHGTDLAVLGTEEIIHDGSGRQLLRWTERWRATVHALPVPAERRDPTLVAELGRLRAAGRQLGAMTGAAQETHRRLIEDRIRRHVHTREGDVSVRRRRFDVVELLDSLGDDLTLVSVVGVRDGHFHVTVASRGRVARRVAGRVADVYPEVDYARFALRAAALAPESAAAALLDGLEASLTRLEEVLLGPAVRMIGDGPVVIVPPGKIQSAPWGALPSLRHRPVTVAPSATAWLRARTARPPSTAGRGRTALIAGANLDTSGAEVIALADLYPDATVLTGSRATVAETLRAIDGVDLAHVGAHGRYRGDSPMFSSLELADGPVTVLDFEQLECPPYRLLLTACESGVGSPTGADELLGLATSLSALGTAGVLTSIVPISDTESVPFSLVVHERLAAGADLAGALLTAREAADGPVATATAWAFLALGAA
ncbi:CHAT domain-containing protein [Phytoactinopolyspora limicola]|uniref:CHAT domain-containing protein n=1 Tax=Phytoactinopolyspora limicola TaxID=2715536 RepID=UPI00140AC2CC|nr:CHAT domain-containing protein [Phytoactinopolyspora limicola]